MDWLEASAAWASGDPDWRQQQELEQQREEREMSEFRDMYNSGKHLNASDLAGKTVQVKIGTWERVDFDDGAKLVIGFEGKKKTLVLNKTNFTTIADAYGDHPDRWSGRPLDLYSTKVDFSGRRVDAIRVNIPVPAKQEPAQPMREDFDDDIPF